MALHNRKNKPTVVRGDFNPDMHIRRLKVSCSYDAAQSNVPFVAFAMPENPQFLPLIKEELRENQLVTAKGKHNFCTFNLSVSPSRITIYSSLHFESLHFVFRLFNEE